MGDSELREALMTNTGGGDKLNPFPFNRDIMGYRMFMSLWNTRAYLIAFINAYDQFLEQLSSDRGITKEEADKIVQAAAKALTDFYYAQKQTITSDEEEILQDDTLDEAKLANFLSTAYPSLKVEDIKAIKYSN